MTEPSFIDEILTLNLVLLGFVYTGIMAAAVIWFRELCGRWVLPFGIFVALFAGLYIAFLCSGEMMFLTWFYSAALGTFAWFVLIICQRMDKTSEPRGSRRDNLRQILLGLVGAAILCNGIVLITEVLHTLITHYGT